MRTFLALAAILVFTGSDAAEMDMTVPYFTSVSLTCDSLALNVSDIMSEVRGFYWILTDGTLVDKDSANLPDSIALSSNAYILNITDLRDEYFGYYHCVVLFINQDVRSVRKGVNVNGPDYTALHEQYRQSAMIGGIAATAMLLLVGGGCLIYHFRFREEERDSEDLYKVRAANGLEISYDNTAMEMEDKTPPVDDTANGAVDAKL